MIDQARIIVCYRDLSVVRLNIYDMSECYILK